MSVVVSAVLPSLVDQVTESLVYGIESCANGTAGQAPFQVTWTTLADAVEWYDIGLTTTTATMALRTTTSPWIDSTAFAFALVGAVITVVAYAEHSKQLAIESLTLSGESVGLDAYALTHNGEEIGQERTLDWCTLGLDGAVLGFDLLKILG